MTGTVGSGSKSTLVKIRHYRHHSYDYTNGEFLIYCDGHSSAQPEKAERSNIIESIIEIDGVRISADSIKYSGVGAERNVTCTTSSIEAIFSFVYKADEFPVDKEIKFYWPRETYYDWRGQRVTTNDSFSFSDSFKISGESEQLLRVSHNINIRHPYNPR